jgi:hypothetical protein
MLTAVHYAVDAVGRIAANDHQAVAEAAADNRLYLPTRLLSDKHDIPHPYTCAPRGHTEALLTAYTAAIEATTSITVALDDLALVVDTPSSVLAAARRASATPRQQHYRPDRRSASQLQPVTPAPGRIEQALRKLQSATQHYCCARQS